MKKRKIIIIFMLSLYPLWSYADNTDSLINKIFFYQKSSEKSKENAYQYGFRIGVNFPLSKEYSDRDHLNPSFSGEFGGFFRYGKNYIFGEVGIGYTFLKGEFESYLDNTGGQLKYEPSIVELRYLQIPLKVIGYYPFKKNYSVFVHLGFIYQPMIQITRNFIEYSKGNINVHQCLITAGIGIKIFFVTAELSYRKSLIPFFKDRGKKYPDFLTVSLGFQF